MSQLELPHDFSGVVRLFPLPNLVVFPSIVQPLHIYESRYREMIEDAIAHDNLIAMATLLPGYSASEYFARPTVSQHVCIGQISKYRLNDDGTYDFILTGIARAEIIEELEPLRSFRSARVRVLTSDETVNNAAYSLAGKLCERLQAVSKDAHQLAAQFQGNQISLRTLTDSLGFHFPFSTDDKLRLLGEPDVVARLEFLLELIPAVAEEPENSADDESSQRDGDFLPPFSVN